MKILCLYGNNCALELFDWLEKQNHEVTPVKGRLEAEWMKKEAFDLVISYTYPYIVEQQIIDTAGGNIINLHTSYLPFEKGSSPNLFNKSSYEQLDREIKGLFKNIFPIYGYWGKMRKKCVGSGTYHREKELEPVKRIFDSWDWNMPVEQFLKTLSQEKAVYDKRS